VAISANTNKSRRSLLTALLGGAALAGTRLVPAGAADPADFNIGLADPVNTVLAMWMAEAAGLYAQNGLNARFINMNGGSHGADELQAGRIDVMHVGLSSVVKINQAGGDLRVIASLSNVIRFVFFSAPGVRSAADLKGGVVGVSSLGSESDSTATLALQRLGLTRADVTIKAVGGGSNRIAAVKSGRIAATALNEPFSSLAKEQNVHVLVDLAREQVPWLFSGVVVQRSALDARRGRLTRFLKATIEGNYLSLSDEARAKDVLAKRLNISNPKILDISYADFKRQTPLTLEPSAQGIKNILTLLSPPTAHAADYVDDGILQELKRDGFYAELDKKYKMQ
jgi:ABC-type nitrate/sulfonate/bicarbonate transport system substrate-binding protein